MVTADLTAAAVYKTAGAVTHARQGSPNMTLAKWLIIGSVPVALLGPWLVHGWRVATPTRSSDCSSRCIGFALLFAAATYALRLYINLRRGVTSAGAPTRTRTSGRWPRWASARSAACWSASPASGRAR